MKSKRRNTRVGMLIINVAAGLLVACAIEGAEDDSENGEEAAEARDEAWGEEIAFTEDELRFDEVSSETDPELDVAATGEEAESDVNVLATCREVTAGSIPVFASSTGTVVRCNFFNGDVFQHFGLVNGRYKTWCPRGAPPPPIGITSYAQAAGTQSVACPF